MSDLEHTTQSSNDVDLIISNDPLEAEAAIDSWVALPLSNEPQPHRAGLLTPIIGLLTVLLIGIIGYALASDRRSSSGPQPAPPQPQTAYNLQVVGGKCQLVLDTAPLSPPAGVSFRAGDKILTSDVAVIPASSSSTRSQVLYWPWSMPGAVTATVTPSPEQEAARKAAEQRMQQEMGNQTTYFVMFSNDGKFVYSQSYAADPSQSSSFQPPVSNLHFWTADGKSLFDFTGSLVGFVPAGDRILALSAEGKPELLDLSGKPLLTLNVIAITADMNNKTGQFVTSTADQTVQIWNADGTLLTTLDGKYQYAHYTEDSKFIQTLYYDREKMKQEAQSGKMPTLADSAIKLWALDGKLIKDFDRSKLVGAARDESRYLTRADDGSLNLWQGSFSDSSGSRLIANLKGAGAVQWASFSPDDKYIITTADDNAARVWDEQGRLTATIPLPKSQFDNISQAQFTPDGRHIYATAMAAMDKQLIWDVNGKLLLTFDGNLVPYSGFDMFNLMFSSKGGYILASSAASDTGLDCLLNTDGKLVATLGSPLPTPTPHTGSSQGHTGWMMLTSDGSYPNFSPDGSMVLTISSGNPARLWRTDGKPLATLGGHDASVDLAEFSPDGQRILTRTTDEARLWDTKGNPIAVLKLNDGTGK